jgi:hypothetical protein
MEGGAKPEQVALKLGQRSIQLPFTANSQVPAREETP